jgi:tetratricopeptide (TPR) repeat protein
MVPEKEKRIMVILVFLSTFALYLATLAPSITVGDSGEFCAASVILGLCHSPGYPLFILLGKAAVVLIPFGSYAFRINLLSAFAASSAVTVLFVLLKEFLGKENKPAAIAAAAALLTAVSPAFWRSAIQAEVFTLNTFFAVLIIYALKKENYLLSAFLLGLGLGNHHTLVFAGLLIGFEVIRRKLFGLRTLALMALCFVIGFSVYFYLPLRAVKDPGLNWGRPSTASLLWRDISRADYGSLSLTTGEKLERNAGTTVKQVKRFFSSFNSQFSLFGILLGLLGVYISFKSKDGLLIGLSCLWAVSGPGFMLLANMPFNAESDGILERFYILVNILWAFPAARGLLFIYERFKPKALIAAAGLALVVSLAALNYASIDWRGYFLEYDYGRNLLRTLKPGSMLLMDGGDDTFYSTAYLCFAEGRRPDVELHDRGGLVFKNIYGTDFRRITRDEKEARRRDVERRLLGRRPLYYSTFNTGVMPGAALRPDGILYTPIGAVAPDAGTANSFACYSLRGIFDGAEYYDYRSRALAPIYPFFASVIYPSKREAYQDYAMFKWGDALWLSQNIRVDLLKAAFDEFSSGRLAAAERTYIRTVKLFPDEVSALCNLGVLAEKRNDRDGARKQYLRAIEIKPDYAEAYYNLAVLYWQESNWQEVVNNMRRVLAINPGDERARRYLPAALQRLSAK